MQPADPKPPSRLQRILAYKWFHICALGVFVLDQLAKAWIVSRLPFDSYWPGERIDVIPGFFNIVHVGNTGAAWSILSGRSAWLAAFAVVVLVLIFISRKTLGLRQRTVQIAFGLLCGGIAGNLVDRLRFGHVVDFLDFHFGSYTYPAFNIADAGIVVGVAIYFILTLLSGRWEKEKA
jgi:signal peptidase II